MTTHHAFLASVYERVLHVMALDDDPRLKTPLDVVLVYLSAEARIGIEKIEIIALLHNSDCDATLEYVAVSHA